ncbi:MAG: polyprenyl synthetase family protein [Chloroflexota bacterium]
MEEVDREPRDKTPAILGKHREQVENFLYKALSLNNPDLHTMLQYHLGWVDEHGRTTSSDQGKGLRSSLCMFACEAVGELPEQALPAAVAIELVHNFSLIHDDIQDGDRERRHRSTLWAIWGTPKALQAGNVMRILADLCIQQLSHHQVSPEVVAMCSKLLTAAYLETVEGQYLDLDFEGRTDINTSNYLDMISRKTGALIRCSMQLGSLVGKGDARTVQALARCGQYLGAVFQIRDDYLGIWGYEEETGKATGNDLRRKKNSLPLVYALEQASPVEKKQLQSIYAKEQIEDRDVASTLALLADLGTSEYIQSLAQDHAARALEALNGIELVLGVREKIQELVEFLLTRQH